MSYEDSIGVVFDIGSQWAKAGFAGESAPRAVFQSTVGRKPGLTDGFPEVYCGREAILKRGVSQLTWPVQEGLIEDWEEMEKLWHHTFYKELMVAPEESRVMHAVHPLVPERHKEQMAEILFETFAVNSIYLAQSPALVVHASGRTSGVVWENGFACCYAAPVFEGFPLKHSIITSPITGQAITKGLQSLLSNIGYSFTTAIEIELLERIKAEICYVAEDYEEELSFKKSGGDSKVRYELPDGQHVLLDQERFQCPEVLFRPALQGFSCPSIVDDICKCISRCDMDFQGMFFDNIVISGGTSQFTGIEHRLTRELALRPRLAGSGGAVAAAAFAHAAWGGGAILAELRSARGRWMSSGEYEDGGAGRVHHKFF
ncbi:hypothetical protein MSG28_001286 [Choristoneura fumiferana]|uniref:Uncharacterized protein n=1 Tax=Choristoneura fumiferana TaxID=7141 RepID=A0ACC0K467_CHOFU|nr:hypothetical protein MSG28_001286 [Choristoneura fumiferana]